MPNGSSRRALSARSRAVGPEGVATMGRFEIPPEEISWRFDTSGGPGGQHANRSATRVELRFDVRGSRAFDEATRKRLIAKLGSEIRVSESGSRSQTTNRNRAVRKLHAMLDEAARPDPAPRRRTRPSRAARQRRLSDKRRRGEIKRWRRHPTDEA